jgi:signal peptidase II
LRRHLRDYAELILVAAFIILFDQWTKWLVTTNLALSERWAPWPWLMPYARIVHWSNTGAAFGMFQEFNQVFKVLPIFVSLFILYYYPKIERSDWLIRLALCMQLGGALGNWIDRIRLDYVIDFVSVGTFAVFNVADSCISVGVVVLILGMYLKERRDQQAQAATADEQGTAGSVPKNSSELAEDHSSE